MKSELEPFVDAETAAKFLATNRRLLLAMARRGLRGAYTMGTGLQRKIWVFRLSELTEAVMAGEYNPPRQSPLKG